MSATATPWLTEAYRKRFAFAVVCAEQKAFRTDFMDWLSRNWRLWQAFEHHANEVWNRGRRHYSARTIGEFLRHESMLRQDQPGEEWKINNNAFPDLARLYEFMHPDRVGFFERRLGPLSVRAA